MATKIEKLTQAQIDRFPEFVKKWTDIGLSTQPANRLAAESAIREMYQIAGLTAPHIVWCGSPLSQGLTRAIVVKIFNTETGASVWDSVYGSHEAGWLSFYDYFLQVCNLKSQTAKLSGLWNLANNAGWILPHKNICWTSDRHSILNRNEQGIAHCDDGPAIAYPDGWQLYYLNGIAVDEQIVMRPETQTVEQINGDDNADRKSIRINRFGWPRYLKEIKAKELDNRRNDIEGTLEALYESPTGNRLVVTCPTGRIFALGTPSDVRTCEAAANWLNPHARNLKSRVIART